MFVNVIGKKGFEKGLKVVLKLLKEEEQTR